MSNTSTADCKQCGSSIDDFYSPGYCSEFCYYQYKGDRALEPVRRSHELCATCMAPIKELEPPDKEWKEANKSRESYAIHNGGLLHNKDGTPTLDLTNCPDRQRTQTESVIGYQYLKTRAESVVKEYESPVNKWDSLKKTGTGCACGVTDPSESVDLLKDIHRVEVLANTVRLFRSLYYEGEVNSKIDKSEFFEAYRERQDWDYALGRGLE